MPLKVANVSDRRKQVEKYEYNSDQNKNLLNVILLILRSLKCKTTLRLRFGVGERCNM